MSIDNIFETKPIFFHSIGFPLIFISTEPIDENNIKIYDNIKLQSEVYKWLLISLTRLNSQQIKMIREYMGYSIETMAKLLWTSEKAIRKYESFEWDKPTDMTWVIEKQLRLSYSIYQGCEAFRFKYLFKVFDNQPTKIYAENLAYVSVNKGQIYTIHHNEKGD